MGMGTKSPRAPRNCPTCKSNIMLALTRCMHLSVVVMLASSRKTADLEVKASQVHSQGVHLSSSPSMVFLPELVLRSLSGITEECSSSLCAFVAEINSGSSAPERCCPAYSLKDLEVVTPSAVLAVRSGLASCVASSKASDEAVFIQAHTQPSR